MLIAFPLATIGCSDDAAGLGGDDLEATSQAVTSPCTPGHDYEHCTETDLTQVVTWQSTLPNPTWRTVEPNPDPNIDYDVIIDVNDLNGGLIPTATNQGQYNDWDHFIAVKNDLLGVDIRQDVFNLIIFGSTLKQAENGGPSQQSWGFFLYDALSDEDGLVFIDNQDVTRDIFNQERMPHFEEDTGSGTNSGFDGGDANTLSTAWWWRVEHHDDELLTDGGWEADLDIFWRSAFHAEPALVVPGKTSVQVSGIRASWNTPNWYSCLWHWLPGDLLQRQCNKADIMDARLETDGPNHVVPDPNDPNSPLPDTVVRMVTIDHYWPPPASTQNRDACGWGKVTFDNVNGHEDDGNVLTNGVDPNNCPNIPGL